MTNRQLMLAGSTLYLLGSVIFLCQAITAKDFWASAGSVAFLVSSLAFVGSTIRDHK